MFAAQDGVTPTSVLYADDVFSTYLYQGTGASQTINNGIDLAGKGGLVWIKDRSTSTGHFLFDSARTAVNYYLQTNTAGSESVGANTITSFNINGFGLGASANTNASGVIYTSWTFRKAPKFFDVVTYTGTGASQVLTHNLGIKPGIVIVKATSTTGNWPVWARETGDTAVYVTISSGYLNATTAPTRATSSDYLNAMTSTTFNPYWITGGGISNTNGVSYVAYLFAHDTSSTGLIQCGSYTGNGSATGPTVTLSWEPQWLLVKNASGTGNWNIFDALRGFTVAGQNDAYLEANTADAEALADWVTPLATGFQITTTSSELNTNAGTYIYMAIRRPNKPPTSGAEVFSPLTAISGNGIGTLNKYNGSNSPNDMISMFGSRTAPTTPAWLWADRLRGYPTTGFPILDSTSTAAEATRTSIPYMSIGGGSINYTPSANNLVYRFARAPGFFDEVCYTGTGSGTQSISHNLGVAPELIIVKNRSGTPFVTNWMVGATAFSATLASVAILNTTGAVFANNAYFNAAPTASAFQVEVLLNGSVPYVAYLFATLPGISKVGTYTGNGTSQTINAGFTTGARFIMIKRTDSTGDWYVWDSTRGIVAANDPHLSFNSTAAEITTDDSVDTDNTGFIVNQVAATNINVTSATYIFLAIS